VFFSASFFLPIERTPAHLLRRETGIHNHTGNRDHRVCALAFSTLPTPESDTHCTENRRYYYVILPALMTL
jgi:hypothetical protein